MWQQYILSTEQSSSGILFAASTYLIDHSRPIAMNPSCLDVTIPSRISIDGRTGIFPSSNVKELS